MPARFGAPRGSIPRMLKEASEIAEARMSTVLKYLDDYTSTEPIRSPMRA